MNMPPSPEAMSAWLPALIDPWRAIAVGFVVEKARRTDSHRTAEVYGRTLLRFFDGVGDPAGVTAIDVFQFAYGAGASGLTPSPSTVCVRLAAISGFYDFACRMGALDGNPAANVRRPAARPPLPRGLTVNEVRRLLAAMPETPDGLLDRAITITALLTGLRRTELLGLRLVDLRLEEPARYEVRTKGGGLRRRELPDPAWLAIRAAWTTRGAPLESGGPVFPISDATFYAHLRRYGNSAGLGTISPHVLRHTAAKLRRQTGATIEEVSAILGHRSVQTTSIYLQRLEDEPDDGWAGVATVLGIAGQLAPPMRRRSDRVPGVGRTRYESGTVSGPAPVEPRFRWG